MKRLAIQFALLAVSSLLVACQAAIAGPAAISTVAATTNATSMPLATATPYSTAVPAATRTPAPGVPTATPAGYVGVILFLRDGALVSLDTVLGETVLASGVSDFTAVAGSQVIALVRGSGPMAEIWTIRRDGSALTQVTKDARANATPSLAPDGSAVVYASASAAEPYARAWPDWGQWCATSEVRLTELPSGSTRILGKGCDPAFGPDGKRIAFATPPTAGSDAPNSSTNAIRLVNRQGANGWNFAKATGTLETGLLVYAPAWSPDGTQVSYHRFLGYQSLVDIGMSMVAPSFKGGGSAFYSGAGWQYPARFTPDGRFVAISEDNYSDARGFGGYNNWSVSVMSLTGSRSIDLPSGNTTLVGDKIVTLPLAQSGTWQPGIAAMAVILPTGWKPNLPTDKPFGDGTAKQGDLWYWFVGAPPVKRLAEKVDFGSPVVWLP